MHEKRISFSRLAKVAGIVTLIPLVGAIGMLFVFPELAEEFARLPKLYGKIGLILFYAASLVTVPFLLVRALFYLSRMIVKGRKDGVGAFSPRLLFNPVNLVLFKSLLSKQGVQYRRRFLMSLLLLTLLIATMWLVVLVMDPVA